MMTIFYDGQCPLCSSEMRHLKQHDTHDVINLVDLHQQDFAKHYPDIEFSKAMAILHGRYQDKILLGLEVTHRAWTLVGKGFWVAPLNWPIIKPISHWVYLVVAKYRQPISAVLANLFNIKTDTCQNGACNAKATKPNHWRK
ncbi:DUF393 domain-containing protein [Psychrosphaera sp. B3R10]|uniref:DUF393 domain-containing protein n=1 Tax=Psychrosphaera algicola TaxID=3023714 RepID=A0ABT5FEA5_9GAMM|nr:MULTISPECIES: DUF393 domain-containing protein [unclassified Psychrosphaera]MBU2881452.1 DUF393 domain-containing protein [Psychrosphaera sp. I2R16]MBU2989536.1 DUF393 domain-containing protein [Psychrosphaera sp. B3R10]MDC2888921.1 DUF393 domain-containing protein [Psychrosphaera sp. G1-22]